MYEEPCWTGGKFTYLVLFLAYHHHVYINFGTFIERTVCVSMLQSGMSSEMFANSSCCCCKREGVEWVLKFVGGGHHCMNVRATWSENFENYFRYIFCSMFFSLLISLEAYVCVCNFRRMSANVKICIIFFVCVCRVFCETH